MGTTVDPVQVAELPIPLDTRDVTLIGMLAPNTVCGFAPAASPKTIFVDVDDPFVVLLSETVPPLPVELVNHPILCKVGGDTVAVLAAVLFPDNVPDHCAL